jgi:hypothetical protein
VNLARLQGDFLDAILAREEPADARLAVYHRSVRANHDAALAAAYPVVRRLVGDAFFGEAAARYAQAFPSRCGDLHVYGSAFALFLAQYEHARDLAYLPDVARLEWAVHESREANQEGRDGTPERTGAELLAVGSDRAFEVRPVAVGAAEWALLEAFAQGASLAEAARECERRSLEFQAALSHLAALDLLDKFHFGPA